jgi:ADP-heptose:LPS heptosyltransferase
LSRQAGLGDVLLCTPALQKLKRVNPACDVTLYTDFPGLLEGLSFVDAIRRYDERPIGCIHLAYEDMIPPRRHISKVIGDTLGLRVTDVRPRCAVNRDIVSRLRSDWRDLPEPRILVSRRAGPWTPNKDWPDDYWEELLDRLCARCTVIEVGARAEGAESRRRGCYVDLRGRTNLEELVAAIAAADVHVGPVSGPVHIAAAVGTPSVVIYGGYEHPVCAGYPWNINLYSPVACSPCWLRDPCPYGKDCLTRIKPRDVEDEVNRLLISCQRSARDVKESVG